MIEPKKKLVSKERIKEAQNYNIITFSEKLGIEIKNKLSLCVWHKENNPSLSYYKNRCKCFSCGNGGDTIALVMQVNSCSFVEAVDCLLGAEQCQGYRVTLKTPIQALKATREDLKDSGEKYTDIYTYFLNLLPFPDENHYLVKERRLSPDIIKENNIRAINSDKTWDYKDKLIEAFPNKERLIKSGIISPNKNSIGYHLFFWKCCAIIPFYRDDKIVYLQGITRPEKREEHGKVSNLKGIQKPTLYIPKNLNQKPIHLSEGIITSLFFSSHDYNSIGILSGGDSVNKIITELLPYKDRDFILCPDVDGIGEEFIENLANLLLLKGFNFNPKYFNVRDLGRELNVPDEKLIKLKDFNDLRFYIKK